MKAHTCRASESRSQCKMEVSDQLHPLGPLHPTERARGTRWVGRWVDPEPF